VTVGTLFSEDFLAEGIKQSAAWEELAVDDVAPLRAAIAGVFANVANPATLNEAQTQLRIIEPILDLLVWGGALNVQTNLEGRGRAHVPDYSLFADAADFARADGAQNHEAKLKHAVAVGDAKQWSIGLDQSGGGAGAGETPCEWELGFLTAPTNERTMIAAIMPAAAFGNKTPLLQSGREAGHWRLAADLNSFPHDYVARQKIHGQTLNLFLVEQFPIVPLAKYVRALGGTTADALVKDHVLRLTYTANDMAPFALDMGFDGPPFTRNEDQGRHLRARLDALYFHLYGITDEADIRYILSTFPVVERKDRAAWGGVYLTAELIIWYFRALAAGNTEALAPEATLLRQASRTPPQ
jgi:hypothetical protein